SPSDNGDNGGSPSDNGDTPTDNDNGIVDTGNETPDNTGDNTPDVYVDDNTRTEEDDIYKNNDNYNSDSDVTLPDAVSYQLGDTKAEGNYDKSNAAYQNGSAKQLLSMLNKNLDLNIHEYVVVDFMAVAKLIDDLDGIEVWMTKQEVIHMNNYCKETSKVTGLSYEEIVPSEEAANYQLNGVQAVSYARIRYTTGNDMKRTQRQRVVIQKIASKAQAYGLKTVQAMITDVFPYCKTSLSPAEIISMATAMFNYNIEKTTGFPFEHLEKKVYVGTRSLDCVVPVTLETNVQQLHEFLFDEQNYQVSETVKLYSQDIQTLTNLTENNIESAKKNSVIGSSGGEADIVK
ncbi:MAG: LCP family protein, partial [Lachnospiraceae bacterium]|nr:LCP family protein [Lachnospiraceae bacterium]